MILAAGLGTRLRPLTDRIPKALVPVAGVPMLEHVARRLVAAGADRLIVNVHHHADRVEAFVRARGGFGVDVRISREEGERPLETGGGLKAAAAHFRGDGPFFLHNVDVITDLDLGALHRAHVEEDALATLATSRRATSRPLLFDDAGLLGWEDRRPGREASERIREASGEAREVAFAGVHVLAPRIFDLLLERGRFSIITAYLRLAREGHRIVPHDVTAARWLEAGTPERLEEARRALGGEGAGPGAGSVGGPA